MPQYIIYNGDSLDVLASLPANSVHCCVSSPPYWGLRAYPIPGRIWGGRADCDHNWCNLPDVTMPGGVEAGAMSTLGGAARRGSKFTVSSGDVCSVCGAWRGVHGNEPELAMYVDHEIEILRAIRRVLRDDGICFWNLGDSYNTVRGFERADSPGFYRASRQGASANSKGLIAGLKPKDLCGVPERVGLAAQADGWWLRSRVVWNKPAPMPESIIGTRWERHKIKVECADEAENIASALNGVPRHRVPGLHKSTAKYVPCPGCAECSPNDGYILRNGSWRPTTSYEIVLMLTKSETYWSDTLREPASTNSHGGGNPNNPALKHRVASNGGQTGLDVGMPADDEYGRNKRNVWTIGPQPLKEDHFAAYPEELVDPCIKIATSRAGVCPHCGKQWAPVTEREKYSLRPISNPVGSHGTCPSQFRFNVRGDNHASQGNQGSFVRVIGWRPTCTCPPHKPVPATVLDPFLGSGTTAIVAVRNGCNCIGIEMSSDYCQMADKRIGESQGYQYASVSGKPRKLKTLLD